MNSDTRMPAIRQSNSADVIIILAWLRAEFEQAGTGRGFWCNQSIIENAHQEGRLIVADDGEGERAIAFQVGGLLEPGILEVRPDKRRMGFGRKLVEYCIARARERDECVLHIECKPVESVPFWKRMGFRLYSEVFENECPGEVRNQAFRVLNKSHIPTLTENPGISVDVCFRAESGMTLSEAHVLGVRRRSLIQLPDRVISYCPSLVCGLRDTFVDVHVDGTELYFGKAKYPEAAAIGVQARGGGVYCIDELILPGAAKHSSKEGTGHES